MVVNQVDTSYNFPVSTFGQIAPGSYFIAIQHSMNTGLTKETLRFPPGAQVFVRGREDLADCGLPLVPNFNSYSPDTVRQRFADDDLVIPITPVSPPKKTENS